MWEAYKAAIPGRHGHRLTRGCGQGSHGTVPKSRAMASLTSSESRSGATVSLPLREPCLPRGLCGCALEWLGRQVGNLPIQGNAVPVRLEQSGEYLQATCAHWRDTFTLLPVTTGPPARS